MDTEQADTSADSTASTPRPPVSGFVSIVAALDIVLSCVLCIPFLMSLLSGVFPLVSIFLAGIGVVGVTAGVLLMRRNRWGITLGWVRVGLAPVPPVLIFLAIFGEMGGAGPILFAVAAPLWGPILEARVAVFFLYVAALILAMIQFPRSANVAAASASDTTSPPPTQPRTDTFIITITILDLALSLIGLLAGGLATAVALFEPARLADICLASTLFVSSFLAFWADRLILERNFTGVIVGWIRMGLALPFAALWFLQPRAEPLEPLAITFYVVLPTLYAIMLLRAGKLFRSPRATDGDALPAAPD